MYRRNKMAVSISKRISNKINTIKITSFSLSPPSKVGCPWSNLIKQFSDGPLFVIRESLKQLIFRVLHKISAGDFFFRKKKLEMCPKDTDAPA